MFDNCLTKSIQMFIRHIEEDREFSVKVMIVIDRDGFLDILARASEWDQWTNKDNH